MAEVVNVIVAFAVIVILFRWITSGSSSSSDARPGEPSPADILGFRPKTATNQMVDQIHSVFPDIPTDNIRYDLLRTGSVELTTNKILERGFLEAPPPAYYTLYPRAAPSPNSIASVTGTTTASTSSRPAHPETLISRFRLQSQLADRPEEPQNALSQPTWEDTAKKREENLKERQARMILAARQRLLAKRAASADSSANT